MTKLFAAALAASVASCTEAATLYQLTKSVPTLSTLGTLVDAAGLVTALNGTTGSITVFAPQNTAFAALGPNILDYLGNPRAANKAALTRALTFHVNATEALFAVNITNTTVVTTLNAGLPLTFSVSLGGAVRVNGAANVVAANNAASNGVAHIIDAVLVPANLGLPVPDIPTLATGVPTLSTLVSNLASANLVAALTSPAGPFTVFAPSNAGFAALPAGLYSGATLSDTLKYHVVSGPRVYAASVVAGSPYVTLNGGLNITVKADPNGDVYVNGISKVITPDNDASNGVVHIVDRVIATANITRVAQAAGTLNTLLSLVQSAGLTSVFSDNSKLNALTVFAPTDAAFAAVPANLLSWLTNSRAANKAGLVKVLQYHVIGTGAVWSRQLVNGTVPTLNGQTVTVSVGSSVKINSATVTSADVNAYNGAVHVINGVLVPSNSGYPTADIPTLATSVPTLSTLVSNLASANLVAALTSPAGPFVVFAPNDDAFGKLPAGLYSGATLSSTLLYHVVSGSRIYAAGVVAGSPYATLNGGLNITVKADPNGDVYVNGISKVITPDNDASNGVVHIVDRVIATANITRVAQAAGTLNTLLSLVQSAGLTSVFSDNSKLNALTVFAPADSAFAALPANLLSWLVNPRAANKAGLTNVLTYHVIGTGAVWSRQLVDGAAVTTLNGQTVTVGVAGSSVTVNSIPVTAADVNAYNGAVHVLGGVLVPSNSGYPTADIPAQVSTDVTLSSLVELLGTASLVGTLSDPNGPYTVFAPVNDALKTLDGRAVATIPLLTDLLKYHVVSGRIYASDLVDGQNLTTLQGLNLRVSVQGGSVILYAAGGNNATVTIADRYDSKNGVVHIINAVLLPTALITNGAGASASVGGASVATAVVAAAVAIMVLRSSRRSDEEEM